MAQGKLGKFGKVLETTPAGVKKELAALHNEGTDVLETAESTLAKCGEAATGDAAAEQACDGEDAVAMSTDEDEDTKKKKKKKKKHKEQSSKVREVLQFSGTC